MRFLRSKVSARNPQHNFTRVKNLEFDKEGAVDEFLSSQFTVTYEDGTIGFLSYKDKGVVWVPIDQPKKKPRTTNTRTRCASWGKPEQLTEQETVDTPSLWIT